jgi:hypothetical protein
MATTIKRAYTGKDVDMLTATQTITNQALNHKTFLITKRPSWDDPFLPNIATRIDNAFTDILGIDNAKKLREQTTLVTTIQTKAIKELAEFKIQIQEDFKKDKPRLKEILTQLGFTQHLKAVQNKDQEALVELLLKFKNNMTPLLTTEITNKGTDQSIIDSIITYADQLKTANIDQETIKGSKKEVTQTEIQTLNDIYSDVISIAKLAAKFFKGNKAVQDQFSYAKTIAALNKQKNTPPPPTPA